jgi:hypothetical protein
MMGRNITYLVLLSLMIARCKECGMIRSSKDLVLIEEGKTYLCFSCWNKCIKEEKLK